MYFDVIINIKNLDLNKIKIDEKSCKNIFIYYNGYVTVKNFNCMKINRVNSLNYIIIELFGYIEESNANKYLTLVLTNESEDTLKKHEELWNKLWNKTRDFIR